MKYFTKKVVDYLYPRRCPICHDIVMPRGARLCPDCYDSLPFVSGAVCSKCGKPIGVSDGELCEDCRTYEPAFDQGCGVFLYDEIMRRTIGQMKFHGRKEYAEVLGRLTAGAIAKQLEQWKPQMLLPIPLHKSKQRMRGFNQAEEIGKTVSLLTGIPMRTDLLLRIRKTEAMKELGAKERRANMLGAFFCTRDQVQHKRILLLDDIYTTGSTMDAAAQVLRDKKADKIYCVSVCIGKGFMVQ